MAQRMDELRRELEFLQRRQDEAERDPLRVLTALIERQSEMMLGVMERTLKTVERQSDQALAFYARDAALLASQVRRSEAGPAASSPTPTIHEPPDAGPVRAGGRLDHLVNDGEVVIGTADPAIRGPGGAIFATVPTPRGFSPPPGLDDEGFE